MSVLAPGAVVGGCRIEGVVGRGGMGVVYLARQLELERDVALKVISPELTEDPIARGRFLAEARAAAAVEHPNVVPVHAVGTEDDLAYLVMRLIRGDDLRTVVRRDGPLSPERAAAVAERIGDALDAIHRAGYVHRDVKPPNVLIDDDGHVYLSDFGLAKAALATRGPTTADHWVGTLDYVAPEQIRGGMVDARTDVYALGGVVHFMLTGQPPFVRDGDEAKLWAHLHDPAPRPSTTAGVPLAFDTIVARALAKEPADRYASAGELGRDALAAARGDDVTAMTVIARRPLAPKGARRWRGVAALGAAAAVGAVAALLLTGDPAPEGSEPPSAEASPTRDVGAAAGPRDQPALTERRDHRARRESGPRSWSSTAATSGSSRAAGRSAGAIDARDGNRPRHAGARPRRVDASSPTAERSGSPTSRRTAWSSSTRAPGAFLGEIATTARTDRARGRHQRALWVATQDRRDEPGDLLRYTRTARVARADRRSPTAWRDMVHGAGSMWLAVEDSARIRRIRRRRRGRFWTESASRRHRPRPSGGGGSGRFRRARPLTRVDPGADGVPHEDRPAAARTRRRRGGLASSRCPPQDSRVRGRHAHVEREASRSSTRPATRTASRAADATCTSPHRTTMRSPQRAERVAAVRAGRRRVGREPGGSAPLDTG